MADKKNKKQSTKRVDEDPIVEKHRGRLQEVLAGLSNKEIHTPAVRARLLAAHLTSMADVLSTTTPGLSLPFAKIVSSEVVAKNSGVVARINAAWRAFYKIDEKRHQRLALIECVGTASHMLGALNTTMPSNPDDGRLRVVAELAKDFFTVSFPELAAKLKLNKIEIAITAWNNRAGRRKQGSGPSKWEAINDIAIDIGLPSVSTLSISREWRKYGPELNGRI